MRGNRYDVIIIGGGIVGATLAFELAKRKAGRILLVEKNYITAGATGRCNAGYRRFWASDFYLNLVNPSLEVYENISEYTGFPDDCEVTKTGYLFPLYTQTDVNEFGEYIRFQNSRDVRSEILVPDEIVKIIPGFNPDGVISAAWSPDDGHLNPFKSTFAFAYGARDMGVEILTNTEVLNISVRNGNVAGIVTNKGTFESDNIYNCTNTGAVKIGLMVGDYVPITKELRQTMIAEKAAPMAADGKLLPLIVNTLDGTWIKQNPCGTVMLGKAETFEYSGDNLEWDFMVKSAYFNCKWMPEVRNLRMIRQYSGEYDNSMDKAPFIQYSQNAVGLKHVCGFSGHGLMIAPEFSKIIAQAHCGEPTELNFDQFNAERFSHDNVMYDPLSV